MEIENREIGSIRPYENNPRHNAHAVAQIAESIKRWGWQQPIVVDADGIIVVGHTRWLAAQHLKLTHVPVKLEAELPPEELRAYRIADNKLNELAGWNWDLLESEARAIMESVSLEVLGFTEVEVDHLLNGVKEWDSDIDSMARIESKDSIAKGRLVVSFDEQHREPVKEAIIQAIALLKIDGVTVA